MMKEQVSRDLAAGDVTLPVLVIIPVQRVCRLHINLKHRYISMHQGQPLISDRHRKILDFISFITPENLS